ncbi:extracellular solute-binding protein [Marinactinospora rubrisoli]|uniref:Extracellular solute-binding protein n=1 Tax=Marinactinospora rubrisoli TaxID=2715399 RepID=A0ABW2KHS3_9ACTN
MRSPEPRPPVPSAASAASPVGRRGFLAASLAAAGTAALGGCAGPGQGGRLRLSQWNLFTGGDGARMVEMHERYQAEHPDVDFRPTTFLWGSPYYTKLATGAAGGRGAHVATLHLSRLRNLAPGRLLDPIPMDRLAEHGVTADGFLPNVWDKCLVDGRLYAVPLDTHPFVTYFNTDICARAGVLDADGRLVETHGRDELFDLLSAVRDVTGRYAVSVDATGGWRLFWTLYRQQDGRMTFDGGRVGLDTDKALTALETIALLSERGLAPRTSDPPASAANFGNAVAGLLWTGAWEAPTFADAGLPFSMTRFHDVYGNRRTHADSHAFVFPHQRDPDPRVRDAAVEYVAFMLRNSVLWAEGGHVPAYQPVAESREYRDLYPMSEYRDVAEDIQFDPDIWFSGSAAQMQLEANQAFEALHAGTITPEAALGQFTRAAQRLLDTPAPM